MHLTCTLPGLQSVYLSPASLPGTQASASDLNLEMTGTIAFPLLHSRQLTTLSPSLLMLPLGPPPSSPCWCVIPVSHPPSCHVSTATQLVFPPLPLLSASSHIPSTLSPWMDGSSPSPGGPSPTLWGDPQDWNSLCTLPPSAPFHSLNQGLANQRPWDVKKIFL